MTTSTYFNLHPSLLQTTICSLYLRSFLKKKISHVICYSICVFLSIFLTSFSHVIAVGKSSFLWLNNIPLCVCVYIHTHYIHIHISFMYSSISGYLGVQYSISDRGMASPKTSFLQTHECSWGELEGVVKYPSLGGLQTFKGLYILK